MFDYINYFIDNYNIPVLTAFLLGILTSIGPCPLATNITAIAYISRDIKSPKYIIISGLFYILGRGISYALLAALIYFGLSSFQISRIFQGWGDKVLGPVLILIGLMMFGVIKINLKNNSQTIEKIKLWLSDKGYLGSLSLGMLFALAFCPYSGVLFFGAFMPLVLITAGGPALSLFFALGTGLPVIIFSFLLAFSLHKVSKIFKAVQKIEKIMRYTVATVFVGVGFYYLGYFISYLLNRFIGQDY